MRVHRHGDPKSTDNQSNQTDQAQERSCGVNRFADHRTSIPIICDEDSVQRGFNLALGRIQIRSRLQLQQKALGRPAAKLD